jgi:hypothetical protein
MLMNAAVLEWDRDLVTSMLHASNACVLSTRAVEWYLVTSAICVPYKHGSEAEIILSSISVTQWRCFD